MKRMWFALLGFAFTLAASQAQTEAEKTSALLDKAIAATGGLDKLGKLQGLTLKGKGAFHEAGKADLIFNGTWYTQGNDKSRTITELDVKGQKVREIRVINGDKGWTKEADQESKQMDKDNILEEKESLYFNWITTLAPLKSKDFKLTPLEEIKIGDKAAAGFTVSRKNNRDVKLYVDKETGLLLKSERKIKDLDAKKDVVEEVTFSDYKETGGIKVAMKFSVKWDGQPQADAEMSEAKVQEKLDDKLFTRPE
jgi:hypothetical protein